MIVSLALLLIASAATSATPPPTIITIKSSPLCNAVRSVVVPAVVGLTIQDRMLRNGGAVLEDIDQMQADHATGWAYMENLRLERLVDKIANNTTIVHQMLDKLAAVKLKDAEEDAQLATLRARLLLVADRQNEALNVLSGSSDSMMANELAGFANPMGAAFGRDPNPVVNLKNQSAADLGAQEAVAASGAETSAASAEQARAEKRVMGALEPVLARCR